jgi:molecular chaperone GrpE
MSDTDTNNDKQKRWEELKNASEAELELTEESSETPKSLEQPNIQALEDELTAAEQKAHESWEKMLRIQAEMENLQRRTQRDVEQARKFGGEKVVQSLIPVLDSLEQANQLERNPGNEAIHKGIDLTIQLLQDILEKNNIAVLNPVGEPFNPQEHEAMALVPTSEQPANTVVAVFQKGYRLHDRIIRPARVTVAKAE